MDCRLINLKDLKMKFICEGSNCNGDIATVKVVNDSRYPYIIYECELEDKAHRFEADLVIKLSKGFDLNDWL